MSGQDIEIPTADEVSEAYEKAIEVLSKPQLTEDCATRQKVLYTASAGTVLVKMGLIGTDESQQPFKIFGFAISLTEESYGVFLLALHILMVGLLVSFLFSAYISMTRNRSIQDPVIDAFLGMHKILIEARDRYLVLVQKDFEKYMKGIDELSSLIRSEDKRALEESLASVAQNKYNFKEIDEARDRAVSELENNRTKLTENFRPVQEKQLEVVKEHFAKDRIDGLDAQARRINSIRRINGGLSFVLPSAVAMFAIFFSAELFG